jgi:hypothetical protein
LLVNDKKILIPHILYSLLTLLIPHQPQDTLHPTPLFNLIHLAPAQPPHTHRTPLLATLHIHLQEEQAALQLLTPHTLSLQPLLRQLEQYLKII